MKKLLPFLLLVLFSHEVFAQEARKIITPFTPRVKSENGRKLFQDPVKPHRPFTVSFGYGTNPYNRLNKLTKTGIGIYTQKGPTIFPTWMRTTTGSIHGAFGLEVTPWLEVGMMFIYLRNKGSFQETLMYKRIDNFLDSWITFMANAKVSWVRHKNFGVYSRFGFGGALVNRRTPLYNVYYTDGRLAWQLSPVGIEAGAGPVRFYAEGGYGYSGVFTCGIRFNMGIGKKWERINQDIPRYLHEQL